MSTGSLTPSNRFPTGAFPPSDDGTTDQPTDRPTDRPTGSPDRPGNGNWECESRLISRWVRSACGCRTDRYKLWAGHAAGASTLSDAGTEREREKGKIEMQCETWRRRCEPDGFFSTTETKHWPLSRWARSVVVGFAIAVILFSFFSLGLFFPSCFVLHVHRLPSFFFPKKPPALFAVCEGSRWNKREPAKNKQNMREGKWKKTHSLEENGKIKGVHTYGLQVRKQKEGKSRHQPELKITLKTAIYFEFSQISLTIFCIAYLLLFNGPN